MIAGLIFTVGVPIAVIIKFVIAYFVARHTEEPPLALEVCAIDIAVAIIINAIDAMFERLCLSDSRPEKRHAKCEE
ncbi:MAG: hypothetical protein AAGH90_00045 [Pseudomonadota bacterium]